MRIHSKIITMADIQRATENLPGVYATASEHGSRTHGTAFEVRLEGNGTRAGYASKNHQGATWDEWGVVIARLFEVDPGALWGSVKNPVYRDAADFHFQTDDRFADPDAGLPADTHKRHNWDGNRLTGFTCSGCSAQKFHH